MIQQRGQAAERSAVGESRLDGIEMRTLKASNQVGVSRHTPMVAAEPRSTEVHTAQFSESNDVQTLDCEAVIERARALAGLTHGQLCAYMADENGKPLDQSLWTRMRREGNLPVDRMQKTPPVFWRAFIAGLAESAGMHVSHADIADLAVARTADAFEVAAQAWRLMQRRAG